MRGEITIHEPDDPANWFVREIARAIDYEVLEALIALPGWGLFVAQTRQTWQGLVLRAIDEKDDRFRETIAAQEAVEWVLQLPAKEILRRKQLTVLRKFDASIPRPQRPTG